MRTCVAVVLVLGFIGAISCAQPGSRKLTTSQWLDRVVIDDLIDWLDECEKGSSRHKSIFFNSAINWMLFSRLISPESFNVCQMALLGRLEDERHVEFLAYFTTKTQFIFDRCCKDYPKRNYLPISIAESRNWLGEHHGQGVLLFFLTVQLINDLKEGV
jgi:hypothetical protein